MRKKQPWSSSWQTLQAQDCVLYSDEDLDRRRCVAWSLPPQVWRRRRWPWDLSSAPMGRHVPMRKAETSERCAESSFFARHEWTPHVSNLPALSSPLASCIIAANSESLLEFGRVKLVYLLCHALRKADLRNEDGTLPPHAFRLPVVPNAQDRGQPAFPRGVRKLSGNTEHSRL